VDPNRLCSDPDPGSHSQVTITTVLYRHGTVPARYFTGTVLTFLDILDLLESDGVLEAVHCPDAEVKASHYVLTCTHVTVCRFLIPAYRYPNEGKKTNFIVTLCCGSEPTLFGSVSGSWFSCSSSSGAEQDPNKLGSGSDLKISIFLKI